MRYLTVAALVAAAAFAPPLPPTPQVERADRKVSPAPRLERADRKTVAVLRFDNNSGDTRYDPLGKGIAAMMITDLSNVDQVQVVERERLQDLIGEMQLQQSKLFDARTAARVGKLAGAEYVVTGAVMALDPKIRIDTRVVRVESGEIVKTAQVTGEEKKFFDLQQRLSKELIKGLDVALSPEEAEKLRLKQEQERIDDLEVQLEYSQALDLFDRKMYVDAAEKMGSVMRKAPESTLVRAGYKTMSERAKQEAKAKSRDKVKGWLRSKIDG